MADQPQVIQSTVTTTINYTPAIISSSPTVTAQAMTTFFEPFLAAMGVVIPDGAVPTNFSVNFTSDGGSSSYVNFMPAPTQ